MHEIFIIILLPVSSLSSIFKIKRTKREYWGPEWVKMCTQFMDQHWSKHPRGLWEQAINRWLNSAWRGGSWLWWTPDGWSLTGRRPPGLLPPPLPSCLPPPLLGQAAAAAGAQACRWNWRTCDKSGRPAGWGTEGRWWRVADSASRRRTQRRQEQRRAEI